LGKGQAAPKSEQFATTIEGNTKRKKILKAFGKSTKQ